jgi:hypothetical protein
MKARERNLAGFFYCGAPPATMLDVIDPIATLRVLNLSAVSRTERTQLEVRFV